MSRLTLLFSILPLAAQAQLVLTTPDGAPVGATYDLGKVPAGMSKDVRFRASNPGQAAIPLTTLAISGSGFSITSPPTRPPNIAPGNFLDIYIHFAGGPPAAYSANFQINTTSVLLVATSVPAPTLSVVSGCTGPDPNTQIVGFAQTQVAQKASCLLSLQNLNSQTITVSSVSVSGSAFTLSKPVATPLTLNPGSAASFTIVFAPTAAAIDSGVLTIDSQSFPLSGTAVNAPLPTPILEFDSGPPASSQQRTLTMRLPTPSPLAASGSVNLSFQPDNPALSADPAVMFVATGAHSVPFTIQPGDLNIQLGGQPGAVFQTGTTSGKITFSLTINVELAGDPPTTFMVIPPAPIGMESASAIARAGALDVQVFGGFDNTYSAGGMSFTFYDIFGKMIQPAPITADFTADFRSYFTAQKGGSDFQMLISFPVSGQANQIGAVDFTMTNSAGPVTKHLTFINDTGQCITISASELLCPAGAR